jgi:hypothetical protein
MSPKKTAKLYFSAWDIISCPRGVYYKKKKIPLPFLHPEVVKIRENYVRVAEAGKLIQQRLRSKWMADRVLLAAENKIPNDWNLWCKFDALCRINGQLILYEIKGVGEEFFDRIRQTGKPREDNRIQIMIYHHFLQSKYPSLKPVLLYVNRKNPDETLEIPVEYSEDEIESLHEKVLMLKEGIEKEIPPEPIENIVFDSYEKRYMVNPVAITCDYHGICSSDDYWFPRAEEEAERLNEDKSGE